MKKQEIRPRPRKVGNGGTLMPNGSVFVAPLKKRHATALRWAERRSRDELVQTVALLFQRRAEDRIELQGRYQIELGAAARARAEIARENARAKQVKNPAARAKAAAKEEAFKLWKERENGLHTKLRTEEQFAMEVCRRWPVLPSIGVVLKWSTEWRNKAKLWPKVEEVWNELDALAGPYLVLAELVALDVVRRWPGTDFAMARDLAKQMNARKARSKK